MLFRLDLLQIVQYICTKYNLEDGKVQSVAVSKLRENMVHFLKKVQRGESITITSRGAAVARLVPIEKETEASRKRLELLRKTAFVGDVVSPIEEEWNASK